MTLHPHVTLLVSCREGVKRDGTVTNFYIFYEIDDEEPPTALGLDNYNGDGMCAWVLLDSAPEQ